MWYDIDVAHQSKTYEITVVIRQRVEVEREPMLARIEASAIGTWYPGSPVECVEKPYIKYEPLSITGEIIPMTVGEFEQSISVASAFGLEAHPTEESVLKLGLTSDKRQVLDHVLDVVEEAERAIGINIRQSAAIASDGADFVILFDIGDEFGLVIHPTTLKNGVILYEVSYDFDATPRFTYTTPQEAVCKVAELLTRDRVIQWQEGTLLHNAKYRKES